MQKSFEKGKCIRAPIAGFINQINKESDLASRGAHMSVAEITPVGQNLLTEVNIEAQHIDHVQTGQFSRVKFISFI